MLRTSGQLLLLYIICCAVTCESQVKHEHCISGFVQGGEPDLQTVSKMVLNDWQRGRIPFFVKPPGVEGDHEVLFYFYFLNFNTSLHHMCELVFCCGYFSMAQMPVEGASEVAEAMQEEQLENPDATTEEKEKHQQRQKEQVQKILSNVRQNFGKINVAPEFTEEDMVPVEIPELELSDFSGSDNEENSEDEEEEEKGEEGTTTAEQPDGQIEDPEAIDAQTGEANDSKNSRQVIRELDDKIAKYKQFLDRAKTKRFSAIRSVCCLHNLLCSHHSF